MHIPNPFRGRQPGNKTQTAPRPAPTNQPSPSNHQQPDPATGPLVQANNGSPSLRNVHGGQLNLVNYSPEELMQHVETTLSTVHFGMSASTRFMETLSELWAVVGPMVLLIGTAGEVFYFIWQYTNDPAWW